MSHLKATHSARRTHIRDYCKVKAEERENKPRSDRLTRRMLEQSSQRRRRDALATETTSSPKPQPARGGKSSNQARANWQYLFKDEHVISLFKLLQKSNRLKLPEIRRPEEVEKIDDPNCCLYNRMLEYLTKNCYIFKDVLQALINVVVLKLRPEQKKVTANMTNTIPLQFGRDLPLAPIEVVPIQKRN